MLPHLQNSDFTLSVEQEFRLVQFKQGIQKASAEELRAILEEVLRQGFVKDNLIRRLIKG